ncbi:Hsp20/alpha crystallin family protein [Roseomonas sp. E05]|uniref:Hsp20/alpha crystallin family protein n=1 Tax=Roseomonas sp. E05 TaxID=3046310 RepID=UPI0024BA9EFD|nr:Hsp20/alpha crystallin family protein [Roseomonas sp. E05]MDJ0390822.1 Hsp20/alpha crystallin family protein [Roseomonas sp. E05]
MAEGSITASEKSTQQPSAPPPAVRQDPFWQPLATLREEVDRLFDGFWRGAGPGQARRGAAAPVAAWRFDTAFGAAVPAIDVVESEKEYRITAELPGMGPGDVDLGISGDLLTIKGEKKEEKEEKTESYYLSERRYGSFQRAFQLPEGVDREKIDASFDKGVLTVVLPKTAEAAQKQRKIEVKAASK